MAAFSENVVATLGIATMLLVILTASVRRYQKRQSKPQAKPTLDQGRANEALDQGKTEAVVRKIVTWRLFITTEANPQHEALEESLTVEALKTALEKKLEISLAGSRLQIAPQLEQYCATLTLRIAEEPFTTRKSFSLELERPEHDKVSLKWVQFLETMRWPILTEVI